MSRCSARVCNKKREEAEWLRVQTQSPRGGPSRQSGRQRADGIRPKNILSGSVAVVFFQVKFVVFSQFPESI